MVLILVVPVGALSDPVPDTGQTKCYDNSDEITCPAPGEAFYGQDANFAINPPSYTKLDDSGADLSDTATSWFMVRDNVTGLIWEVKQNSDGAQNYSNPNDADNRYTWYDSNPETNGGRAGWPGDGTDTEDFINALNAANYGGNSDWRLPTAEEFLSIVNFDKLEPSSHTDYFPNTKASVYWSSTTLVVSTANAWHVHLFGGATACNLKANTYHVRAVRTAQSRSLEDFVANGDGTITDAGTGLMWEQKTNDEGPNDKDNVYTWEEALSLVASMNNTGYIGYNDWRLPTINELGSLADRTRNGPSINTAYFTNTQPSNYWSSTTSSLYSDDAWRMSFNIGEVLCSKKSNSNHLRAVRGGQTRLLGHLVILTPVQGTRWNEGSSMPITWDTAGVSGNVSILISRDGGKTYKDIISSIPNNGTYDWVVTGPGSVNCMLKIVPDADLSKATNQGFFSIISAPGDVDKNGVVNFIDAITAIQIVAGQSPGQTIYKSGDINTDGKIGLEEAVNALQVISGAKE